MAKDVKDQLEKIMDDYRDKLGDVAEDATKKVAEETAKNLRENSPKQEKSGGGRYAKGWSKKKTGGKWGAVGYVVYNNKRPGMTHLLEKGHAKANQYGRYAGSVPAQPHIKDAEQKGIQNLIDELESKL